MSRVCLGVSSSNGRVAHVSNCNPTRYIALTKKARCDFLPKDLVRGKYDEKWLVASDYDVPKKLWQNAFRLCRQSEVLFDHMARWQQPASLVLACCCWWCCKSNSIVTTTLCGWTNPDPLKVHNFATTCLPVCCSLWQTKVNDKKHHSFHQLEN